MGTRIRPTPRVLRMKGFAQSSIIVRKRGLGSFDVHFFNHYSTMEATAKSQ